MSEVEELCSRVVFINGGKIIANDTPENLAKTIEFCHMELVIRDGLKRMISYCDEKKIPYKQQSKRAIIIDVKEKEIPDVLYDVMKHKILYDEISIEKPTLEDYFLQMTKK